MTVSKATIPTDVYQLIYNRISSTVTTVTLADTSTRTIQKYTGFYSDLHFKTKSDYPVVVIEPIEGSWEDFTLRKKNFEGVLKVQVYDTKNESADRFIQAIIDTLETYRGTLWAGGNDVRFFQLTGIETDNVLREKFILHVRTARFTFEVPFTKTYP